VGGPVSPDVDVDADAGLLDVDGDEDTSVETGTAGQAADRDGENGVCTECDSAAPSNPVLEDWGAIGNVTNHGSLTAPTPSEGGACNYGSTKISYFAAINVNVRAPDEHGQWQGGKVCGQCALVRIKTPDGWKETVVRIMDKCTDEYCGIVLGGAPARDMMGERPGRYQGSWSFVSCEGHPQVSDGSPAIHVKEGSSASWALVQVRNPLEGVIGINWRSDDGASGGAFPYASEAENYFRVPEQVLRRRAVLLTINYRNQTSVSIELNVNQLVRPRADIPLP
jgi:hypothetical protein